MAVIELALLHFKAQEDPSVKTALVQAQQAQEEHSKHKVRFLRQVKDPSYFFLFFWGGGWSSLETHIAQRAHYQGQLVQLADCVGVDWMFHFNADMSLLTFLTCSLFAGAHRAVNPHFLLLYIQRCLINNPSPQHSQYRSRHQTLR
jgi:hypothetical protein